MKNGEIGEGNGCSEIESRYVRHGMCGNDIH
jgi:hypothetical protein